MVEFSTRHVSYRGLCPRDSLIISGETFGSVESVPRKKDGVCYSESTGAFDESSVVSHKRN